MSKNNPFLRYSKYAISGFNKIRSLFRFRFRFSRYVRPITSRFHVYVLLLFALHIFCSRNHTNTRCYVRTGVELVLLLIGFAAPERRRLFRNSRSKRDLYSLRTVTHVESVPPPHVRYAFSPGTVIVVAPSSRTHALPPTHRFSGVAGGGGRRHDGMTA